MSRRSDRAASDLETIDLGAEAEGDADTDADSDAVESQARPAYRASRPLTVALALSAAVVVIAGLAFLVRKSDDQRDSSGNNAAQTIPTFSPTSAPPPVRSDEPLLGRFYPVLDRTAPTLVLPTGRAFTLARGASSAIGGLGAMFFGTVTPKGATCCTLSFDLFHAAPSDLFATLGAAPISIPTLVSSAHAVQPDLQHVRGRFGVLSTGDWTLIASFERGDHSAHADAFVFEALSTWHLESTPYGAVLRVPAGTTVNNSEVDFGRVPDLTDKAVDFVKSDPCQIGPTPMFFGTAADTTGRWCDHDLAVTIEGPRSYVEHAVAALEITPAPPVQ